jgi:hypothetical protein
MGPNIDYFFSVKRYASFAGHLASSQTDLAMEFQGNFNVEGKGNVYKLIMDKTTKSGPCLGAAASCSMKGGVRIKGNHNTVMIMLTESRASGHGADGGAGPAGPAAPGHPPPRRGGGADDNDKDDKGNGGKKRSLPNDDGAADLPTLTADVAPGGDGHGHDVGKKRARAMLDEALDKDIFDLRKGVQKLLHK